MKQHVYRHFLFALIGVLILALAACGPAQSLEEEAAQATAFTEIVITEDQAGESEQAGEASETAEETAVPATEEPEETAEESEAAPSDFDLYAGQDPNDFTTTASGLEYYIFQEGDGQPIDEGRIVRLNVTGYLDDGTVLFDTREQPVPAALPVGGQTGLLGLDEAMTILTVGSSARIILPPELAFGDTEAQGVPPGSTVVFDLELLELVPLPPEAPTAVDEEDYTVTDSGLKYYDIAKGEGPVLEAGQTVFLDYTGWLEDGTMFDSSLNRGQPLPVTLGAGGMIPGFDEALLLDLQVGDVRQLIIPSDLAYGEEGRPPVIPPSSNLIFEIEVLGAQ